MLLPMLLRGLLQSPLQFFLSPAGAAAATAKCERMNEQRAISGLTLQVSKKERVMDISINANDGVPGKCVCVGWPDGQLPRQRKKEEPWPLPPPRPSFKIQFHPSLR